MVTLVVVIDVELLKKIDMAMASKEKKKEEEKKKGDVSKEELCSMKGGILSIFIFIGIAPHSTPKRKLLESVLKKGWMDQFQFQRQNRSHKSSLSI